MASLLVVEDGTGLPDADSYATMAFIDDYHAKRGNTSWAAIASDSLKDTHARNATWYIELKYGSRFRGRRKTKTQALSHPVVCAYDDDEYPIDPNAVHIRLKYAQAEAALRASIQDLFPDPDANTQGMTGHTVRLGPIMESKDWASGGGYTNMVFLREVHYYLRPLITTSYELHRG